jgi:hypothetical protein
MKMMTYQYSNGDIDLHYDYIFVQRCPDIFVKALNSMNIVESINFQECYDKHGVCTIQSRTKSAVETHEFEDFIENIDSTQGKNYQIIYIENYQPRQHRVVDTQNQGIKIINASISYPTNNTEDTLFELSPREITKDIYLSQVCEVLDLVTDDNTILVADLHFEDSDLPEEAQLEPRGLINHASDIDSFNKPGGKDEWISLQKIITTENSNINISKVICKKQEGVPFGHHPLEFTI